MWLSKSESWSPSMALYERNQGPFPVAVFLYSASPCEACLVPHAEMLASCSVFHGCTHLVCACMSSAQALFAAAFVRYTEQKFGCGLWRFNVVLRAVSLELLLVKLIIII